MALRYKPDWAEEYKNYPAYKRNPPTDLSRCIITWCLEAVPDRQASGNGVMYRFCKRHQDEFVRYQNNGKDLADFMIDMEELL